MKLRLAPSPGRGTTLASKQDEFTALVERYARVVSTAIRRVCSRQYRSLIPDVEQEVYLALWKRLESGKEIEHPASYLYKAALTTALAVVRKHAPETMAADIDEISLPQPKGGSGDLLPAERARLLGEALDQLSPEEARAVRAHLAGFNHLEVASLFGWSASVARHRIYRGIDTLKRRMKGAVGDSDEGCRCSHRETIHRRSTGEVIERDRKGGAAWTP